MDQVELKKVAAALTKDGWKLVFQLHHADAETDQGDALIKAPAGSVFTATFKDEGHTDIT